MSPASIGAGLAAASVIAAGLASLAPERRLHGRSRLVAPYSESDGARRRAGPIRRRSGSTAILVLAGVGTTGLVLVGPPITVAVAVGLVAVRAQAIKRRRQAALGAVDAALPDLIDLLAVASAAGHPVRSCVESVVERGPEALSRPLEGIGRRLRRGDSLAASLDPARGHLGSMGTAVIDALLAAHASGAALTPVLDRLAVASRDSRRRAAEERARRLPVALLFPLVCCVLPAFGLLAVVPLLAGSLGSLRP